MGNGSSGYGPPITAAIIGAVVGAAATFGFATIRHDGNPNLVFAGTLPTVTNSVTVTEPQFTVTVTRQAAVAGPTKAAVTTAQAAAKTSAPKTTTTYALEQLCAFPTHWAESCSVPNVTDPIQVGSVLFTPQLGDTSYGIGNTWNPIIGLDAASGCVSLQMHFAVADTDGSASTIAYVRVTQGNNGPVMASAAHGKVGTLTAKLNGSPFHVEEMANDNTFVHAWGTAEC